MRQFVPASATDALVTEQVQAPWAVGSRRCLAKRPFPHRNRRSSGHASPALDSAEDVLDFVSLLAGGSIVVDPDPWYPVRERQERLNAAHLRAARPKSDIHRRHHPEAAIRAFSNQVET